MKTSKKITCIGKGKQTDPASPIKMTIDIDDICGLAYERDGGYSIDLQIVRMEKPDHLGRQYQVFAEYKDPVIYMLYPY